MTPCSRAWCYAPSGRADGAGVPAWASRSASMLPGPSPSSARTSRVCCPCWGAGRAPVYVPSQRNGERAVGTAPTPGCSTRSITAYSRAATSSMVRYGAHSTRLPDSSFSISASVRAANHGRRIAVISSRAA